MIWFILAAVVGLGLVLVLARAAALGDEQLGYKSPPSPLARHYAESEERRQRALIRAGYTDYPIVVPAERIRLGLDHANRGAAARKRPTP